MVRGMSSFRKLHSVIAKALRAPGLYPEAPAREGTEKARRMVWVIVAAAALMAIWPRAVRLDQSFSSAEIARVHLSPDHQREAGMAVPGLLGQAEISAGRNLSGGDSQGISERPFRIIPWIAGILTVGLVALLGCTLGGPRGGLAAGFILALHPAHIAWSAEGGGVSTVLLCFTVALSCLIQALRANRARWWTGLALSQAAGMLFSGLAFPALAALNVAGLIAIFGAPLTARNRLTRAGVLVALSVISIGLPALIGTGGLSLRATSISSRELWSAIVGGLDGEAMWRGISTTWVLPLCAVLGLIFLWFQDWRARLVALSLAAATGLSVALSWREGTVLWGTLLLPFALTWMGAGLARLFPRDHRARHAGVFIAILFVMTVLPALHRVMAFPAQPLRETALTARQGGGTELVTAFIGLPGRPRLDFYDPNIQPVSTMEVLNKLVDSAYLEDRPLLVCQGAADPASPDGEWEALRDEVEKSGRFRPLREFPAADPRESLRLYRYQPHEKIIRLDVAPKR